MEYITKKYFKKLKKKLFILKKKKKKYIKNIKKAIEKGDLSENYEYISAKEDYYILINKINNLKNILINSKIIKNKKNNKKIKLFSKVTIKNLNNNKINKYKIVSNIESNIFKKKLSIDSPISLSLIGKKKGDIIKLSNNIKYKIIKIE